MKWDGKIPVRRYAIFNDILRGNYTVVITEKDIETAERWGGFKSWLGKTKPAETRNLKSLKYKKIEEKKI